MNIFQPTHLILVLVIVLIVFGPGKLPDIGQALGKSIKEFRKTSAKEDDFSISDEHKSENKY
jgi:sec-independent protein translocase protein TatA